jgi:hypothetical protein
MKSPEDSFDKTRSALSDMIWSFIEALNKKKGVNHCGCERTRDFDDKHLATETSKGQVWTVAQTYMGARTEIEGVEIDPDRTIDIKIAATYDWIPIVNVMSSLREHPIEIVGGTDMAVKEAIQIIHDEIFCDWPLSRSELEHLARRLFPDAGL